MANSKTTNMDSITYDSDKPRSEFLDREEAYYKLNQELEKRSNDLIARMEMYSKSRPRFGSGHVCEDGFAHDSQFMTDDGLSSSSDLPISPRSSSPLSSQEFDHIYDEENEPTRFKRNQKKLFTLASTQPSTVLEELISKDPQLKQQKNRLEKATESVMKTLQTKLLNHEERLAELHLQYRQKIQENTIHESKIKLLEEEREKLLRTISNQQNVIDKHAKSVENSKNNLSVKSQTVTTLRKEIEELKREKKQANAACASYQTRLHRVAEENEKLKSTNKTLTLQMREFASESKSKLDERQQRILDLERQRHTLNGTITKQTHMIKLLREQQRVNSLDNNSTTTTTSTSGNISEISEVKPSDSE